MTAHDTHAPTITAATDEQLVRELIRRGTWREVVPALNWSPALGYRSRQWRTLIETRPRER